MAMAVAMAKGDGGWLWREVRNSDPIEKEGERVRGFKLWGP